MRSRVRRPLHGHTLPFIYIFFPSEVKRRQSRGSWVTDLLFYDLDDELGTRGERVSQHSRHEIHS